MAIAAVQLLWINLLTDSAPAISLSLEKAEKNVMNFKNGRLNKIFDLKSVLLIALQSIFIAFVTLFAYSSGNDFGDTSMASTYAFSVLGMSQIFHCFNCKFEGNISFKRLFNNAFMNLSVIFSMLVFVFLLFTPAGALFGLVTLNFAQFILCLALSVTIIPFTELLKFVLKKIV